MAQMMNKMKMRRILHGRNKASDLLVFNEEYLEIFAALIDKKNHSELKREELRSKKKLLPLEIAALPADERNEVFYEREINALLKKQELQRRIIKQASIRIKKRSGEDKAQEYLHSKEQKLEQELEKKKNAARRKYPENAPQTATETAEAAYRQALVKEEEKAIALAAIQQTAKKRALDNVIAKKEAQNRKLKERIDIANQQLLQICKVDPAEFGSDTVLSVENVKMYFSGIKAVDDLSFKIKQGEIFGLIGPNGAGKTTLFNCITQFYKPDEGNIFYRDIFGNIIDLTDYKTHEVIRTGISRTFQNLEMVNYMSILDNLLVGAHSYYRSTLADQFIHTKRLNEEEAVYRKIALELLERMGISEYKDRVPAGLPYGVLKKVEFIRTLVSKPKMIILDEPAAGLNDAETEELAEIIRIIRNDFNCTIFLVEHDMNLVMNVCDRVCAISFGKMLAIGPPLEIRNNRLVQEAYLGLE